MLTECNSLTGGDQHCLLEEGTSCECKDGQEVSIVIVHASFLSFPFILLPFASPHFPYCSITLSLAPFPCHSLPTLFPPSPCLLFPPRCHSTKKLQYARTAAHALAFPHRRYITWTTVHTTIFSFSSMVGAQSARHGLCLYNQTTDCPSSHQLRQQISFVGVMLLDSGGQSAVPL